MSNGTSWECANSYLELLLVKYDKIYLPYKFYYWRIGFPGKVLCAHINGHSANSTSYNCDSNSIFSGLDINEYLAIIFKRLQGYHPQGCRWRLRRSCGHTELSLASRKFFYSVRNTKNQLNAILLINMDYWGAAHSQEGLSQLPWKFQIYLMTPSVLSGVGLVFGYGRTPVVQC